MYASACGILEVMESRIDSFSSPVDEDSCENKDWLVICS